MERIFLAEEHPKKEITVLWLDNEREPNKHLYDKTAPKSNNLLRNRSFYENLGKEYIPKFVWVKNFEEFV